MKPMFAVAAFSAATLAVPVLAHVQSGGHYEWQTRQMPGPNKTAGTSRVRVWVPDQPAQTAECNCDMMKADPADCMKKMSGGPMARPGA